jgi:hypothetical protein
MRNLSTGPNAVKPPPRLGAKPYDKGGWTSYHEKVIEMHLDSENILNAVEKDRAAVRSQESGPDIKMADAEYVVLSKTEDLAY